MIAILSRKFSGNSTMANLPQRARFGAMLREFVLEVRIASVFRPSLPFDTAESKSARTVPKPDQLGEAATIDHANLRLSVMSSIVALLKPYRLDTFLRETIDNPSVRMH